MESIPVLADLSGDGGDMAGQLVLNMGDMEDTWKQTYGNQLAAPQCQNFRKLATGMRTA